jgi:hypothetical protein
MCQLAGICLVFFLCSCAHLAGQKHWQSCLPPGIQPADIVSATLVQTGPAGDIIKKVEVKDKLERLQARCHEGKLVDGAGKKIYFYRLIGCWGMPPANYEVLLHRQNDELKKLREQYTVIELTCNPSGIPHP